MLFASDLDQTLIYSKKHIPRESVTEEYIRLVETLDGNEISYMTEAAISLLQDLMRHVLFVPVTTRTLEQYSRIAVFKNELPPLYAVTSNGGNILKNGIVDEEWNQSILTKVKESSAHSEDILAKFEEIKSEEWFRNGKMADNLFYYCIVNRENLPIDDIYSFGEWTSKNGWNLSVQGRKIYLVPDAVNKTDAIVHIKEVENIQTLVSSGDSLLDYPLLKTSHHAIAPSHGEIFQLGDKPNFPFTKNSGIYASEEILDFVLQKAKKLKLNSV